MSVCICVCVCACMCVCVYMCVCVCVVPLTSMSWLWAALLPVAGCSTTHWYTPLADSSKSVTDRVDTPPEVLYVTRSDWERGVASCSHTHSRGGVPSDEQLTEKLCVTLADTSGKDDVILGGTAGREGGVQRGRGPEREGSS